MVGFASHAPLLFSNEPCHVKRLELCLSLFAGLCNHTFSLEVWLVVNGQLFIGMLIFAFWHVKRKGLYLSHLPIPAIATSLVFGRSVDIHVSGHKTVLHHVHVTRNNPWHLQHLSQFAAAVVLFSLLVTGQLFIHILLLAWYVRQHVSFPGVFHCFCFLFLWMVSAFMAQYMVIPNNRGWKAICNEPKFPERAALRERWPKQRPVLWQVRCGSLWDSVRTPGRLWRRMLRWPLLHWIGAGWLFHVNSPSFQKGTPSKIQVLSRFKICQDLMARSSRTAQLQIFSADPWVNLRFRSSRGWSRVQGLRTEPSFSFTDSQMVWNPAAFPCEIFPCSWTTTNNVPHETWKNTLRPCSLEQLPIWLTKNKRSTLLHEFTY